MTEVELKTLLEEHLHGAQVHVEDLKGTGSHFKTVVGSPDFAGKSLVEQHRMVYQACNEYLKREIHALQIETLTPEQYHNRRLTDNRMT
ncbi:BolA family protein [Candidatus Neomarinimicrobiota bacterium]